MTACPPYGAGNCGSTPTTTVTTSIGTPVHRTPHGDLAFTGGDVLGVAFLGLALVIVGLLPRLCRFVSARGWQ